jgi:hypothetical protein
MHDVLDQLSSEERGAGCAIHAFSGCGATGFRRTVTRERPES